MIYRLFTHRTIISIGLLIILAFVSVTIGCSADEDEIKVLNMGLIPADDAAEMLRNYEPVVDYLEDVLGLEIELQVTNDYTAAIEAMRNKHIDIAWFGPFSYVLAVEEAGAEAIVNGVRKKTGKATCKSMIVSRSDSAIHTLEDLKENSFAFVDPASTSGHLIPKKILLEAGIDPDREFSTVFFAGTHNAVGLAVKNGTVDAGALSDTTYERMLSSGDIEEGELRIVNLTNPIPGSPIAVRGDLPPSMKTRIQKALVDMDQQTIHEVKGWGDIERYQTVLDSDYDIIRETSRILGLDPGN